MAERQQALAAAILKDPDVVSLSSFIGVDGTNPTLNTGRMLINLKPFDQGRAPIGEVIQHLKDRAAALPGIRLYLQPVQDLTVESSISRTQYQLVLQDTDANELALWTPKLVEAFQKLPELT